MEASSHSLLLAHANYEGKGDNYTATELEQYQEHADEFVFNYGLNFIVPKVILTTFT